MMRMARSATRTQRKKTWPERKIGPLCGAPIGVTTSAPAEDEKDAADTGPAMAAAAGYAPADIKRNCDIAKRNLTTLEGQKPAVDADGYPVDLDAAKAHQAQIDKANQQIKLFCGTH